MDGLIRGTLVLTPDCAFVDGEDQRELIVWPYVPESWRWDPTTNEIVSLRLGPTTRELRFSSGDPVVIGGGDVPRAAQEEMIASISWVAPPRDGCMTPTVFFSNGELSEWDK
jgi:hypothetical protein